MEQICTLHQRTTVFYKDVYNDGSPCPLCFEIARNRDIRKDNDDLANKNVVLQGLLGRLNDELEAIRSSGGVNKGAEIGKDK